MSKSNKNNPFDDSGKASESGEQRAADQTIKAIEFGSPDTMKTAEHQKKNQLLGKAIRSSAELDLPAANDNLRALLTAEMENADAPAAASTTKSELAKANLSPEAARVRWSSIAVMAATTLVICGLCYLIWSEGQRSSEVALGGGGGDLEKVEEQHQTGYDTELQIQELVKDFNRLADQRRYVEAEAVARQAKELDPGSAIVAQLNTNAGFLTRNREFLDLHAAREHGNYAALGPNLHRAATAMDGLFPDSEEWIRKIDRRVKFKDIQLAESPSYSEEYAKINDNPFRQTIGLDAVSTFSIDVDTASYANVRRFINNGQRVPPNAVRIEEMVNYFDYEYEQPADEKPFSVNMELATCPWNPQHKLLRVGLQGKEVHQEERPASNIVFLLDVSGSMNSVEKLPLLKSGVEMMVNQLTENDSVSIVTYAGNAGVVLEPTPGNQKRKIVEAIHSLNANGSTNGSAGIQLAYELAQNNFVAGGTNKVILATDGDLNVGTTSDEALVELITEKAKENVFLTVLGFGTGNLKDSKLEKLADYGNGMYAYIDGVREARKVLVEGISGSLVTIAKDVKLQIEFNPTEVKSYRLIGYENRILARQDFDNDAVDAGEIGAGHTVTALYELVTTDVPAADTPAVPPGLKYQKVEQPSDDSESTSGSGVAGGEMLTLALRFKQPESDESERIEFTLQNESKTFTEASRDFRFAASVAAFGMILRQSEHRGDATTDWVMETATAATGADLSGYRKEFVDIVRRSNMPR